MHTIIVSAQTHMKRVFYLGERNNHPDFCLAALIQSSKEIESLRAHQKKAVLSKRQADILEGYLFETEYFLINGMHTQATSLGQIHGKSVEEVYEAAIKSLFAQDGKTKRRLTLTDILTHQTPFRELNMKQARAIEPLRFILKSASYYNVLLNPNFLAYMAANALNVSPYECQPKDLQTKDKMVQVLMEGLQQSYRIQQKVNPTMGLDLACQAVKKYGLIPIGSDCYISSYHRPFPMLIGQPRTRI